MLLERYAYSNQPRSLTCFPKNIKDAPRLDTLRHTFLQNKKHHLVTRERGTRSLFEMQGQTSNSAEVEVNELTAFRIVSVLI